MDTKNGAHDAIDSTKEPKTTVPKAAKQQAVDESEYHVYELAVFADKFGTTPEVVITALKEKGACMVTKSRAAEIIKEFLKREVK